MEKISIRRLVLVASLAAGLVAAGCGSEPTCGTRCGGGTKDDESGTASFETEFNLAPVLSLRNRVVHGAEASTVEIWLGAIDPDATPSRELEYSWSAAGCDGVFLEGEEHGDASPASGLFPEIEEGLTPELYFKFEVAGEARAGVCPLTVEVSDGIGAKASSKLTIVMAQMEPTETP